jgi:branched-subunit amino acid aminotransferase/4-amino-4-deoxychorismate lyase
MKTLSPLHLQQRLQRSLEELQKAEVKKEAEAEAEEKEKEEEVEAEEEAVAVIAVIVVKRNQLKHLKE